MRNIIAMLAALTVSTTAAQAIDLGKGFAIDSTTTFTYQVEAEDYVANQELELTYLVRNGFTAFAYTQTNLRDVNFTGLDIGARYTFNNFEVESAVQLDADLGYTEAYVSLEIKF
jgi:hypothetical protein